MMSPGSLVSILKSRAALPPRIRVSRLLGQLGLGDEGQGIGRTHVEGIVGSEKDVLVAVLLDQVFDHLRFEDRGVEVEFVEVFARLA